MLVRTLWMSGMTLVNALAKSLILQKKIVILSSHFCSLLRKPHLYCKHISALKSIILMKNWAYFCRQTIFTFHKILKFSFMKKCNGCIFLILKIYSHNYHSAGLQATTTIVRKTMCPALFTTLWCCFLDLIDTDTVVS